MSYKWSNSINQLKSCVESILGYTQTDHAELQ